MNQARVSDILLTDREADLMHVLWERGPSLVREVRSHLHDELAYTTVLTVLRTLEAKGYVKHQEEGKGHRYSPAVELEDARRSALRHLTNKLFAGSSELLLTHFLAHRTLSARELQRFRDTLDRKWPRHLRGPTRKRPVAVERRPRFKG